MSNKLIFSSETGNLIDVEKIKRPRPPLIIVSQTPYILIFTGVLFYFVPGFWPGLSSHFPFLTNMFISTGKQFPLMAEYISDPENLNHWYVFFPIMAVFTLAYLIQTFTCRKWNRRDDDLLYSKLLVTLFSPVIFGLLNWLWELLTIVIIGFIAFFMLAVFTESENKNYRPLFVIHIAYSLLRIGFFFYGLFEPVSWTKGLFDVFYMAFLAIWIIVDMFIWSSGRIAINFKSRLVGFMVACCLFLLIGYAFTIG